MPIIGPEFAPSSGVFSPQCRDCVSGAFRFAALMRRDLFGTTVLHNAGGPLCSTAARTLVGLAIQLVQGAQAPQFGCAPRSREGLGQVRSPSFCRQRSTTSGFLTYVGRSPFMMRVAFSTSTSGMTV